MQEEVTQKTIALVIKTSKLTAGVLKAAMRMYLNRQKQKAQRTHGKISVKKLVGEGAGVSSIDISEPRPRPNAFLCCDMMSCVSMRIYQMLFVRQVIRGFCR